MYKSRTIELHKYMLRSVKTRKFLTLFFSAVYVALYINSTFLSDPVQENAIVFAIAGVVLLAVAIFFFLSEKKLFLTADEKGLSGRISYLKSFSFAWNDLEEIEWGLLRIVFKFKNGKTDRLTLLLYNAEGMTEIHELINSYARDKGISVVKK